MGSILAKITKNKKKHSHLLVLSNINMRQSRLPSYGTPPKPRFVQVFIEQHTDACQDGMHNCIGLYTLQLPLSFLERLKPFNCT